MHNRKILGRGFCAAALVAACLISGLMAQAIEKPDLSGKFSKAPAKQSQVRKHKKSKSASAQQKAAEQNRASKTEATKARATEVAQLKQQIALQQKQINQLLHAVEALNARLGNTVPPAPAASVTHPSSRAEVASLVPILPPEPKVQAGTSRELLSMNTSVNPSGTARTDAAGIGAGVQPRSGVAGIAGAPAQGSKDRRFGPLAFDKIKLGVTFFGDYGYYPNSGFGPQFLTQINQPGPGNGGFNSFDITRAYLNFFYTPFDAVTLRITPNIYRQIAGGVGGQANGTGASFGASANGNLAFRLKYAYIDFNHPFKGSDTFGKDKITIGQTTNPWIDWEEGLYGYRYVNLVPWNYISLSSTYGGAKVHGPIMINGKEYLDYDIGVFNTQSFHSLELTDKKQVMGRLTWYPMGTKKDRTGFGLTVFEDYGSNGKSPDTHSTPDYRFATVAAYQTHDKGYELAGEFDMGHNAFSMGNMFSGAAPVAGGPYGDLNTLSAAILAGDRRRERGFAFFGHARLGGAQSPWALFGMYQYWQPNTNVSNDPLDFARIVGGISYKVNKHLDFAFDSQNLMYTKSQFTFPANELPSITTPIPNAVPDNTNAIFFNMQFNY